MPTNRSGHTLRVSLPGTANSLAARRRGDSRQFRRQRKAHVFADQIQIALIREAELRQSFADLLHEDFRRRGPRGQAHARNAFKPLHVDVVCVRKESLPGSSTPRASTAATESTTMVRSGASPEVPTIS